MNKEELIGKLQMTYIGDRNAFNELVGYYDGLKQGIDELQQENKKLKDNWNKLKEYINKNIIYDDIGMKIFDVSLLEDKMAELEILKGENNE